ncbi:hypothetical protein [Cytobacillus solani]|nr:hypothetical protein [Cytobacillus solani]
MNPMPEHIKQTIVRFFLTTSVPRILKENVKKEAELKKATNE